MVDVLSPDSPYGPSHRYSMPCEVDVYRDPHSRMRELMTSVLEKVELELSTLSEEERESILQSVYSIMWEMKTHEIIENNYIVSKLKERLSALKIYNRLVCNCHEDSTLFQIIELVENLYTSSDSNTRSLYWERLKTAVYEFTDEFLPHMEEEETLFQPLLYQYFGYEELKQLKETVVNQHRWWKEKVAAEKNLNTCKEIPLTIDLALREFGKTRTDYCDQVKKAQKEGEPETADDDDVEVIPDQELAVSDQFTLPEAVLIEVFSYLSPKDLLLASRVCRNWRAVVGSPIFWRELHLAHWSRGIWTFHPQEGKDDIFPLVEQEMCGGHGCDDLEDDSLGMEGAAEYFLTKFTYFLPRIGLGVRSISLFGCGQVCDQTVSKILMLCPGLEEFDASYTSITDRAMQPLSMLQLKKLDLSGCSNITDRTLQYVATSKGRLTWLSLSGCRHVTDSGILYLGGSSQLASSLTHLDLSGCDRLSGSTIGKLTSACGSLLPEHLFYCNLIEDGPYPDEANGCQNLECGMRNCCLGQ